jgi:hypothetical protein
VGLVRATFALKVLVRIFQQERTKSAEIGRLLSGP